MKRTVWIVRENDYLLRDHFAYVRTPKPREVEGACGERWSRVGACYVDGRIVRVFLGRVLKPGEGPVRVTVEVE